MRYLTRKAIRLQKRSPFSHKGENGRVLLVGGSRDYPGAALLAGMAAYRSGADKVTIAAPSRAAWAINALSPDIITKKFTGDFFSINHMQRIIGLAKEADCCLLGNGIGKKAGRFSRLVAQQLPCPAVIDADALHFIDAEKTHDSIITPHQGELRAFMENNGLDWVGYQAYKIDDYSGKARFLKKEIAKFLAQNNVLLLKGHVDIILSADQIAFNRTGNPGMTAAGTGDVLAGLCAGIAAQHNTLFMSACAAAYVNGAIGGRLARNGYGFVASDFISHIRTEMRGLYP